MAGWAATGLFSFNPERVLRGIQKPAAKITVSNANNIGLHLQEVLQTPTTPILPVTTEALISLQNLIQQDAHTLDKMSK